MQETEDRFRNLFATDRNNFEIQDKHLMLINVYDNVDSFQYHPGDELEVINKIVLKKFIIYI